MALTLAEAGFFRPRWSEAIVGEFENSLAKQIGDKSKAAQQRSFIETAFPEGLVEINETALERLRLPDDDDRHVLAAAIKARAAQIVTENINDFPAKQLEPHEIEAVSSDYFFAHSIALAETEAVGHIRRMRERLNRPAFGPEDLILRCEQVGLPETASILNEYIHIL